MSGFLDRMAAASRDRVTEARAREPLAELRARALATPLGPPLQLRDRFNLIAEFKRRSPALGRLGDDDLVGRVTAYAHGGAAAVSVLTEPSQFHGSLEHLATAAVTLAPFGVPAMRKDFIVDPYQIYEARAMGADCILLIVAALHQDEMVELERIALGLGMAVLVEVHDAHELERASGLQTPLFGINNRNLRTFETRLETTLSLLEHIPRERLVVTESGILAPADVERMRTAGVEAFLVGEAFMRAPDPGEALAKLFRLPVTAV